ncbi:integrase/recombinase xerD homolog [Paroedura picta]|uniref:integrase/recombinase xerD homolog n=1 Tax=Paroedura picta TaxID=143630 RepID=UPI00405613A2
MGSIALSTRRSYERAAMDFVSFAHGEGGRGPWPMNERLLLSYLAHLKGRGQSHRSIRVTMAGLKFFSKAWGSWDPSSSFLAGKALKGWGRASTAVTDARRPITMDILLRILSSLGEVCTSRFEVTLFRAAFTLAFHGAFRCSELVAASRWAARSPALRWEDVRFTAGGVELWVRRSKTDQDGKGTAVFLHRGSHRAACPVSNLCEFLSVRPGRTGLLFVHRDGSYLSRYQLAAVLKRCLRGAGLRPEWYGTHSFRIGAATQAFREGAEPEEIMRRGRWHSKAYAAYIR